MSDATSPIDPEIAARLAALEATVASQRAAHEAALEVERMRRAEIEAERDRLVSEGEQPFPTMASGFAASTPSVTAP